MGASYFFGPLDFSSRFCCKKFSTIQDVGELAMPPPLQIVPEKIFATEPFPLYGSASNCPSSR
jgi:hypothetical protein